MQINKKTAGQNDVGGGSCDLKPREFKMGAGFKKGTQTVGYTISNNSSGPEASAGACSGSSTCTPITNGTTCGNTDKTPGTPADGKCTWTATNMADLCS